MESIQEIADILRSTDKMAAAFVSGIRERLGVDVPETVILQALKRLNPRTMDMAKAVAAVQEELARQSERPQRRSRTRTVTVPAPGIPATRPSPSQLAQDGRSQRPAPAKNLADQLEEVLERNWSRAEREGFRPERMSPHSFVQAVHRHCDPRDANRSRVVRACKALDRQDVIITPTVVADIIRRET